MSGLVGVAVDVAKDVVRAKILAWLAGILVPVLLVAAGLGVLALLVVSMSSPPDQAQAQGCVPGGAGTALTVSERQNVYARTVIGVARSMGFGADTDQAAKIALMTVAQESGFQNYANDGVWTADRDRAVTAEQVAAVAAVSSRMPHDAVGTDNDSVGLFQARPFAGWATFPGSAPGADIDVHVQRLMNPVWQAQVFFLHLQQVAGWQSMEPGRAAQRVQVSAFPTAYAKHEVLASALLSANADAPAVALLPTTPDPAAPAAPSVGGDGTVFLCGSAVNATGSAAAVIAAARTQIGLPYSWGAGGLDGPSGGCGCAPFAGDARVTGFDCSGLTRYAIYQGTGVQMGRTSREQFRNAAAWGFQQVPYAGTQSLQPGDLVFFGHTSDPGDIYHVAIATGAGTYVEARNHAAGVVEGPAWTGSHMWVVRPPYDQMNKGESA